ncbi:unnamed protein product [Spirodela intermedia]|uniref:NADH-ubiquinone oxidoreductase chain 3 n=1 Tax=Spirodela intermedia TaxID=51605 RepID=A0A7I8K3D1_SPIIN|nr:unnamed protein product [Spirodela intermedia]
MIHHILLQKGTIVSHCFKYGYESGVEPMGDAWLQFRNLLSYVALVFVVFDIEFDVLGVSVYIEGLVFVLIAIAGSVYA